MLSVPPREPILGPRGFFNPAWQKFINELRKALNSVDYSDKADKVSGAVAGNFAGLNAAGNLTDSGHKDADYADAVHTHADKADKVAAAVAGNFAGLDAAGNLTDSGHKDADYADAVHVHADLEAQSYFMSLLHG